ELGRYRDLDLRLASLSLAARFAPTGAVVASGASACRWALIAVLAAGLGLSRAAQAQWVPLGGKPRVDPTALVRPASADIPRVVKHGSLSPLLSRARDQGSAPRTDRHPIVVGLALRQREALEAFLADVQDPASPRYHRFLTQDEFNALYAPDPTDEEAVVAHLEQSGLTVTDRAPNRLLVGAVGSTEDLERACGVALHAVAYRGRRRFAAM